MQQGRRDQRGAASGKVLTENDGDGARVLVGGGAVDDVVGASERGQGQGVFDQDGSGWGQDVPLGSSPGVAGVVTLRAISAEAGVGVAARWDSDELCAGCPGQGLELGEFDVTERPDSRLHLFVKTLGDGRVLLADQAVRVCVHPWRVRLPVGAYASQGLAVPDVADEDDEAATMPPREALNPPTEVEDLHAWLTATLRLAGPAGLDAALEEAQTVAFDRFPQDTVLGALRDVLGRELTRPNRPRPAPRSRGGHRT